MLLVLRRSVLGFCNCYGFWAHTERGPWILSPWILSRESALRPLRPLYTPGVGQNVIWLMINDRLITIHVVSGSPIINEQVIKILLLIYWYVILIYLIIIDWSIDNFILQFFVSARRTIYYQSFLSRLELATANKNITTIENRDWFNNHWLINRFLNVCFLENEALNEETLFYNFLLIFARRTIYYYLFFSIASRIKEIQV